MRPDPVEPARASLRRSLAIYSALTIVDLLVFYWVAANSDPGAAYVTLSFVGVVGLLLGYQLLQHARDLSARLAESDGYVDRKWSRADLLVAMESYYVRVDHRVFRLKPEDYISVDEGMFVKVVHFPNTLNVVSIHEMARPVPPPPEDQRSHGPC